MSTRLEEVLAQKRKRLKAKYLRERALCQKWIAHCKTLLLRINEWLQPLEAEGYLEIQWETISIWEDQFGEYEVPALRLVFFDRQILAIRPVAYLVIGSRGRVDITAGNTPLAMLLHSGNGEWAFARREGRYGKPVRRWSFNKVTFEEFLVAFLEEEYE